ncbi:spore germination protein [Geosporobacter subterraneus DSM 17957]|uniref:Spore germination protein n=1 Tax=Geosporobacter subterraneus DSM 17957 TaxID=1121919 RepID=A0A1M6DGP1_9FIRM|nr:spore germination protein [Geosporobacter subterraneus]SHI72311.1 spore germination protein [Geosporobacter subterraneus DSM 17957]
MDFFKELFSKKKNNPREKIPVKKDYHENLDRIKEILAGTDDVVYREFKVGKQQKMHFATIFIDGLADKDLLNESVLKSLMLLSRMAELDLHSLREKVYEVIRDAALSVSDMREVEEINEAVDNILSGETLLIFDNWEKIVVIATKKWPSRGVTEPSTETVIRGAQEGFTETMRMNTALIRRRIRDPKLCIKQMQIGRRSKTDVAVIYIEEIVNKAVLKMVKERLDYIDIDNIMESGYIEQLIEDEWRSPFPQIQHSQRPDVVAAALYEGRVVILVDNTPFALIAPATITALLQSPEDYYERFFIASAIRLLRYFSLGTALLLPAIYIAITSYHPGMLPTSLALYVAGSRNNVPFPAFIEAFIMEGAIELLREAGIRLPAPIGATIGIVGGLVLGQAAVEAGIVSPLMVIVVALTAMAAYSTPSYSFAIAFRLLRFMLMAAAAFLGLYGVMLALLMILTHLCNLKSFGVPYLSPYAASSTTFNDFKDSFIKVSLRFMQKRPQYLHREDSTRLKKNPIEPAGEEDEDEQK